MASTSTAARVALPIAIGFGEDAVEQFGQVRPGTTDATQLVRLNAGPLQFVKRACGRPSKPGHLGHWTEVIEVSRALRLEGRARDERFDAKIAHRTAAPTSQRRHRQPCRQLHEARSHEAEEAATPCRDLPRDFVSGRPRGADHEGWFAGLERW